MSYRLLFINKLNFINYLNDNKYYKAPKQAKNKQKINFCFIPKEEELLRNSIAFLSPQAFFHLF